MIYDKREDYINEIRPYIDELKKVCIQHRVPFFFTACIANDEQESCYDKEMYSGLSAGMELTQDYFPDLVNVTLGFETRMPKEALYLEPEGEFKKFGE